MSEIEGFNVYKPAPLLRCAYQLSCKTAVEFCPLATKVITQLSH